MINYLLPVSLPCMHANNTIHGNAKNNDVGSQVHCFYYEKTAGRVINGREALLHEKKTGVPEIHVYNMLCHVQHVRSILTGNDMYWYFWKLLDEMIS